MKRDILTWRKLKMLINTIPDSQLDQSPALLLNDSNLFTSVHATGVNKFTNFLDTGELYLIADDRPE